MENLGLTMHWQDILAILVPLMALMAWVYKKTEMKFERLEAVMDKRFQEVDKRFQEVNVKFKEIHSELSRINESIHGLDRRLIRLETRFEERGYPEIRKTGTHDEER